MTNALVKAAESAGIAVNPDAILKSLNLNPADPKTQALLLVCDRYGLDPLLKHMVLIQGSPYVTRDGYLAIAHRSGQFDGMEVLEQSVDATHFIARVAVYRKDMGRPFTFVGRFPKNKNMAKEYGPEMAVKVAEVQALRRAFNVTGVGAADERWDIVDTEIGTPTPPAGVDQETGEITAAPMMTRTRPSPLRKVVEVPAPRVTVEDGAAPEPAPSETVPADDLDLMALQNRIAELDPEHQQILKNTWKDQKIPGLSQLPADRVNDVIDLLVKIEEQARKTFLKRQKHANAVMGEVDVKSDDARHALVKECTNGDTESTKRLTEAQLAAIVDFCGHLKQMEAEAEQATLDVDAAS